MMVRSFVVLALFAAVAHAGPAKQSSRKAVHYVDTEGGVYDVPVHHDVVTTLYFQTRVVKLFCPHLADFHVDAPIEKLVTIRPKRDAPMKGHVQIVSGGVKVSLNLYSASRKDALQQVHFYPQSREEAFEAEVARRTAKRLKEAEAVLQDAAEVDWRRRLLSRTAIVSLGAVARSDDHVVVRIPRALVVGGEAYVFFEVQNRDDRPFVLEAVQAKRAGRPVSAAFSTAREGAVSPGRRVDGVVQVPFKAARYDFRFSSRGRAPIVLRGVEVK